MNYMSNFRIKVKNYRCFGHEPQEVEIGSGFTALIGTNNSGKTAFLRIFYELRHLWNALATRNTLGILDKSQQQNVEVLGVQDTAEIFNHYTNAPIEITFIISPENSPVFEFTLRLSSRGAASTIAYSCIETKVDGESVRMRTQSINSDHFAVYQKEGEEEKQINLSPVYDLFDKLRRSIYIPSFRNVVNMGANENLYDIATGTAFINQWNEWKVGSRKFARDQINNITADIKNLFGFRDLEINASTDKTTLRLTIDGKSYSLPEVGSGLAQFILTFATAAIKTPSFIFLDEPELNLHPALQLKFLASLGAYASDGVVFATHSIGLARSAERIYSVVSDGKTATIKPFENTPDYLTLLGELSFSAYREIGANSIFFVEGVTELKTVQELLRKYGKDTKVLLMSLGGNDMINGKREYELSEITTRLKTGNIYAWVDSERPSSAAPLSTDRSAFLDVCKKLGITAALSERRSIENYFTERAVRAALRNQEKTALTEFEKLNQGTHWRKEENWKIAKETQKEEIAGTDLGRFIDSIEC